MATQAGPLMVRHVIDGHDVMLPTDAVLSKRMDPTLALCNACLGDGGSEPFAREIWICGECGGSGQVPPDQST